MATVIKASGVGKIKKHLETLVLKDHMAEAQRIVHEARVRAARIIEDAQAHIQTSEREARRTGYEQGFAEGRAVGEASGHQEAFATAKVEFLARQEQLLGALEALMSSFEEQKEELIDRATSDVLLLAIAMAERITKRTAALDREVAVANARDAIRHTTAATDILIRINPVDAEAMRRFAGQLAAEPSRLQHVDVLEDAAVDPGGCIVESTRTRVDATIDGQFQQAVALFLGNDDQAAHNAPRSDRETGEPDS